MHRFTTLVIAAAFVSAGAAQHISVSPHYMNGTGEAGRMYGGGSALRFRRAPNALESARGNSEEFLALLT